VWRTTRFESAPACHPFQQHAVEQLAVETHHSFLASHRYFIDARPVAETPDSASKENNKKNYLTYQTKGC
jgi:hypothetical protein